ncbi:MAG: MFS transporter [Candidatus Sphingomonas phytovorans]|nr:MFS transporter [Sphingomonas sp.]WEK02239.1 MAG: MFS transporter [Sphingomonas sp.]
MDLMDTSALATAMPALAVGLRSDPVQLKLALTAYLATVAVLVPASGWLSNRIGAKRLFLVAMAVFMLGSIACGMAQSLTGLVLARVMQGIGGSMMTPVGRSIIVAALPKGELVRAMSWFAIPAILAPMVGPPIAGFLLEAKSWRWIFWINIPVGIIGMIAIALLVPRIERHAARPFDWPGFVLAGLAILSAMITIETGALTGHPWHLRLFASTAPLLLATLYLIHARRAAHPIIDIALLKLDTLRVSLAVGWLQRMAMGAMTFMLPLLLQIGLGYSAFASSQVLVAMAFGSLFARFLAPALLDRLGFRTVMIGFAALSTLLTAVPALFEPGTPIWLMSLAMALLGLFRSSFFIPAGILAYADTRTEDVPNTTVLFTVAQQLSLGAGVTLAGLLLEAGPGQGVVLNAASFVLPFAILAALSGATLLVLLPMRRDAAEQLRRRR